ncbi:MAG: choline dehydrogenase [Chromatiales bacterium]|jgi:choline dehydrogenase|nr:choline dehydrogenase [Chromatiales bacterium]
MNSVTTHYDYVIVGAGSAGCVLASRLSEDPNVSVCLLEAGKEDRNVWIHIPAGYVKTMSMPGVNWLFDTEPDAQTGNRAIPVPRGRVLGGSSSINGLLYVRGQALDYDGWAQRGNRGWSYADVLPYFRKSEHREGTADTEYRGQNGPLNVADLRETDPVLDMVIQSAQTAGYPHNHDYNGAEQEGFGYYQTTMKEGRRVSTAKAFLHPVRDRPNLTVETNAHVVKVIIEGHRAVGVEFKQRGQERRMHAGREVILAAGTVQSPQLLELSGVGQPDRLRDQGIAVTHELPGVGENLHDHYIVRLSFELRGVRTLNERLRGLSFAGELLKFAIGRKGALTIPAGVAFGFVRTRPELASPDVQYHIAHASFRDPKTRKFDHFPGLTIGPCQLRPVSRGSVHIRSADPFAPPTIQPNFLHAQEDRQTLLRGMRIARDVAAAGPLGEHVVREVTPGPHLNSDKELLDYAAQTGATVYHPVGTCKMGSDPMAVVDHELKVHGLEGLRVIDASIMPQVTSGNTNAPAIMIAEKGADLIKAAHS